LGRRVKKAVYAYGSDGWELEKEILFVYDGWNLIQEIEVSAAGDPLFDKFYVWGPDLFQSIQGAGGIGGLVCRVSGGEVRHYFYDANGNVGQLVNPADGAVTARYEYDPFGKAVFVDGADAAGNAFRFSTKYWDGETDLYYYGYRYYLPELGRWVSKDPLGEDGGVNHYGFVGNEPVGLIDFLGLTSLTHVDQGIVFYTWHMGWIDKSHAYGKNKSLESAWKKIKSAKAQKSLTFELSMSQTGKQSAAKFCITLKSDSTGKKNQLLFAWMLFSNQFESFQGEGLQGSTFINRVYGRLRGEVDKIPSSFSTEDLVSNLVHYYAIVDGKKASDLIDKYAGRFSPNDERLISRSIWLYSLKPEKGYRGWSPKYFDHQNYLQLDFGGNPDHRAIYYDVDKQNAKHVQSLIQLYWGKFGEPTFPYYFQKYTPTQEGVFVNDQYDK
jgi:RHS repeat-associated protein